MSNEQTITIKKGDLWKYSTFLLIALVVIGGFFLLKGNGSGNSVDTGTNGQEAVNANSLIESNDPVLGNPDASVTILEFSDFQCPYCARAHDEALTEFEASDYFKDGDVNLIYKQFPLSSIHPYAEKAAEASLCAAEQDMFWEYHDTLFANQGALDTASLKGYASQLGLDTGKFNDCLDSGDQTSEVSKETAQATAAGGRGTPFFIIVNRDTGDATTVSGAYPWTTFEQAINAIM